MAQAKIIVDGEQAKNVGKNLSAEVSGVPSGARFSAVSGDSREPATESFKSRLRISAEMIGRHADVVRAAVKENAEALTQAVDTLRATDQLSAADADRQTDLVTATARTTSAATVASSEQMVRNEEQRAAEEAERQWFREQSRVATAAPKPVDTGNM